MSENIEQESNTQWEQSSISYPPKPVIADKSNNSMLRSLLGLFAYALLFYVFFEQSVVYVATILLVIIVHEMGHFIAMRIFNYSNVKIFIVPLLGAFTSGKKQEVSQRQMSIIILAGPLPGIIFGSLLLYVYGTHNETIANLAYTFLLLNVFNLLPFYPLDGGRLLETLFSRDNFTIRLVFGIISIIVLGGLFLLGKSFFMLIIPLMIALELRSEWRNEKIRAYLRNEKINYHVDYDGLPNKAYWLIRDCILFSFPKKYAGIEPGRYEYTIIESALVQHVSSVLKISFGKDLKFFGYMLLLLLYIAAFAIPAYIYFSVR